MVIHPPSTRVMIWKASPIGRQCGSLSTLANPISNWCSIRSIAAPPALDAVKKHAANGVVIVRITRLLEGLVLRNNEVNDDEMRFVASGEFNPVFVQLAIALVLYCSSAGMPG